MLFAIPQRDIVAAYNQQKWIDRRIDWDVAYCFAIFCDRLSLEQW